MQDLIFLLSLIALAVVEFCLGFLFGYRAAQQTLAPDAVPAGDTEQ